jgi:hypothetical protein
MRTRGMTHKKGSLNDLGNYDNNFDLFILRRKFYRNKKRYCGNTENRLNVCSCVSNIFCFSVYAGILQCILTLD